MDYIAPRGDRVRISLALLLTAVALLLSDVLLLLQHFGVHSLVLWLSLSVASYVLLFVALAILLKELCRNRFFSAVVIFIVTLLIVANCIFVAVVTF
ncbi:MAG: hypothetical protein K2M95_02975 [Clostridiales bacterium]|nr:hypothetical protein [Clostridiales bacterium]